LPPPRFPAPDTAPTARSTLSLHDALPILVLTGDTAAAGPVVVFQFVDEAARALTATVVEHEGDIALDELRQPRKACADFISVEPARGERAIYAVDGDLGGLALAPVVVGATQRNRSRAGIEMEPGARITGWALSTQQNVKAAVGANRHRVEIEGADRRTELVEHPETASGKIEQHEHRVATLAGKPIGAAAIDRGVAVNEIRIDANAVQHIADGGHEIRQVRIDKGAVKTGGETHHHQPIRFLPRERVVGV